MAIVSPLQCRFAMTICTLIRICYAAVIMTVPLRLAVAQADGAASAVPVGVVVAGGVSLGSYQGGVSWSIAALLRELETAPESRLRLGGTWSPRIAVLAGASAGNINSLLTLDSWCREKKHAQWRESLNWRAWGPVGIEVLVPEARDNYGPNDGVLSRKYMRDSLKPIIDSAVIHTKPRAGCDVHIATTMTSLSTRSISRNGLSARSQRVITIVHASSPQNPSLGRMTFAYPDSTIRRDIDFVGQIYPTEDRRRARADSSGRFEVPASMIFEQALASSAFPVAFSPVKLTYFPSLTNSERTRQTTCKSDPRSTGYCAEPEADYFVDGGVFDNTPLMLARSLLERADDPKKSSKTKPMLIFVDAGFERGRSTEELPSVVASVEGGLDAAMRLLGVAIPTARQYELQTELRRAGTEGKDTVVVAPGGRKYVLEGSDSSTQRVRVVTSSRRWPVYGGQLGAFGAFVGRPLREFDFLMGIYDGTYLIAREVICPDTRDADGCTVSMHQRLLAEQALGLTAPDRAFLTCLAKFDYAGSRPKILECPIESAGLSTSGRDSLSAYLTEFLALQAPLYTEKDCRRKAPVPKAICGSQLYRSLARLSADTTFMALLDFRERSNRSYWDIIETPGAQGKQFAMALLNPEQFWSELAVRATYRAWEIEQDRFRLGQPSQKGVAKVVAYGARAVNTSLERGFHPWFDTPAKSRVYRLVPQYFSLSPSPATVGLGYVLASPVNRSSSIAFDVRPLLYSRSIDAAGGVSSAAHVGVLLRKPGGWYSGAFIGLGGIYAYSDQSSFENAIVTALARYSFLFQRVSVGTEVRLRNSSDRSPVLDRSRVAFFLQFNDINGLAYWIRH